MMHPRKKDSDGDHVADPWEDTDADGLMTIWEFRAGTHPRIADTDGDGTRDGAEDPDGDGLTNLQEQTASTMPRHRRYRWRRDAGRPGGSGRRPALEPDRVPGPDQAANGRQRRRRDRGWARGSRRGRAAEPGRAAPGHASADRRHGRRRHPGWRRGSPMATGSRTSRSCRSAPTRPIPTPTATARPTARSCRRRTGHRDCPMRADCPICRPRTSGTSAIDDRPVASNSATLISTIGTSNGLPHGLRVVRGVRDPVQRRRLRRRPRVSVAFDCPTSRTPARIRSRRTPRDRGNGVESGDRHILLVDKDALRALRAVPARKYASGHWHAGSGAIFDLRSNDLRPDGWTSADAAGLPILPGPRPVRRGRRGRDRPRAPVHAPTRRATPTSTRPATRRPT